ncbi:MAG: hypothetical protein JO316_08810 [Abitibacteriaceae bacterium]|nr:hypothetical protein [Abditibacteriaceae bacterium]MBV9865436.1 hypothetical protein [Abditibacteriaceae bacterium]
MLAAVQRRGSPFCTVLMDSWYAAQAIMRAIDALGKIYYCPPQAQPLGQPHRPTRS